MSYWIRDLRNFMNQVSEVVFAIVKISCDRKRCIFTVEVELHGVWLSYMVS